MQMKNLGQRSLVSVSRPITTRRGITAVAALVLAMTWMPAHTTAAAPKKKSMTHEEAHAKAVADARARAAAQTARAAYQTQTNKLLDAAWQAQLKDRREPVLPGKLVVRYQIRPDGKVENLQMVNDKAAGPGLKNITLQAFKEVRFPRMPAEVVPMLVAEGGVPAGRLGREYTFTVSPPKNLEAMKIDGKSALSLYADQVHKQLEQEWPRHMAEHPAWGGLVRMSSFVRMDGKVVNVQVVDDAYASHSLSEGAVAFLRALRFPPMPAPVVAFLESKPERERVLRLPCTLKGLRSGPPAPVMAMDGKSPLSRYANQVSDLLAQQWKRHLQTHAFKVAGGSVKMSLEILPDGRVQNVQVVEAQRGQAELRDAALTVLRAVKLPPMPAEVAAHLSQNPKDKRWLMLPCTFAVAPASAPVKKKGA